MQTYTLCTGTFAWLMGQWVIAISTSYIREKYGIFLTKGTHIWILFTKSACFSSLTLDSFQLLVFISQAKIKPLH